MAATRVAAAWWDDAKTRVRLIYISAGSAGAERGKRSFKKRLTRLKGRLQVEANASDPEAAFSNRWEIVWCKLEWAEVKAQYLRRQRTAHLVQSFQFFYAQIATKFTGTGIHRVCKVAGKCNGYRMETGDAKEASGIERE